MLEKELTRKEFLLSILSIGALFALSKIPTGLTNKLSSEKGNNNFTKSNAYGKHIYGKKIIA